MSRLGEFQRQVELESPPERPRHGAAAERGAGR